MPVQLVDVTYAPGSAPLIESLTLALHDQIRLGIVGENGSGKSTLLRLMSGDLRPERGEVVRKNGLRLVHVRQDDASAAALSGTVADALFRSEPERDLERLGLELAVASGRGDQRRLDEIGRDYDAAVSALASAVVPDRALVLDLLGDLGLRGLGEERRLSELSGGQRRLIELTRSLALQPDLLLLDEPEAHLDLRARGLLADRLAELARRPGGRQPRPPPARPVGVGDHRPLGRPRRPLRRGVLVLPRGAPPPARPARARAPRGHRERAPARAAVLPAARVGHDERQVRRPRPLAQADARPGQGRRREAGAPPGQGDVAGVQLRRPRPDHGRGQLRHLPLRRPPAAGSARSTWCSSAATGSPCSARTAPASRRCCGCSPASSRPSTAGCGSRTAPGSR